MLFHEENNIVNQLNFLIDEIFSVFLFVSINNIPVPSSQNLLHLNDHLSKIEVILKPFQISLKTRFPFNMRQCEVSEKKAYNIKRFLLAKLILIGGN